MLFSSCFDSGKQFGVYLSLQRQRTLVRLEAKPKNNWFSSSGLRDVAKARNVDVGVGVGVGATFWVAQSVAAVDADDDGARFSLFLFLDHTNAEQRRHIFVHKHF